MSSKHNPTTNSSPFTNPLRRNMKIKTAMEMLNDCQHQNKLRRSLINDKVNMRPNMEMDGGKQMESKLEKIGHPYMRLLCQAEKTLSPPAALSTPTYKDPLELGLGITEISGEAGCGKTQICLGLCVSCAMSVLPKPLPRSKPIVYNPYAKAHKHSNTSSIINQELNNSASTSHFCALYASLGDEGGTKSQLSHRLDQMIRSRLAQHYTTGTFQDASLTSLLLSRVWIRHFRNLDEFREFIDIELNQMFNSNRPKIGLIVLDSMSGLFRHWEDYNQDISLNIGNSSHQSKYSFRTGEFFRTASRLKWISEQYNVPIVAVNQMVAKSKEHQPALGLSWSHCVNTRFLLTRNERAEGNNIRMMTKPENNNYDKYNHPSTKRKYPSRFDRRLRLEFASNFSFHPNEDIHRDGIQFKIETSGPTLIT